MQCRENGDMTGSWDHSEASGKTHKSQSDPLNQEEEGLAEKIKQKRTRQKEKKREDSNHEHDDFLK